MNKKINKIVSYIGIAVLIAALLSFSGCIGGGNNAKESMKMIPTGTLFIYADLGVIKNDEDLNPMYDKLFEGTGLNKYIQGQIKWIAIGINLMSPTAIASGNFDLDEIEKTLEYKGFYKDTYNGVEVWIKKKKVGWFTKSNWIMLHKDKIIGGTEKSIKSFISVEKGDKKSMYDDKDCRDVIDRVGNGFITRVVKRGPGILGALPAGVTARATSWKKIDSKTIGATIVIKYEDEDTAKNAEKKIRKEYEDLYKDVKIKVDHEYIIITAKSSIKKVLSVL